MAVINVNHENLAKAADGIRDYTSYMCVEMRKTDYEMMFFVKKWRGKDADAFRKKWREINSEKSVYRSMRSTINAYADFLEYSSTRYFNAHAETLNDAKKL